MDFFAAHQAPLSMDMSVGPKRRLSADESMLLNCVVLDKTVESPLDCKEIQPVHSKGDQS